MLPNFKLYYKAAVIKTVWCWQKNKHIINRIKNQELEINPHVCGQLMWKEGKYIQWVKTTSSINGEQLDANNQTGLLSHITYKNKLKMS